MHKFKVSFTVTSQQNAESLEEETAVINDVIREAFRGDEELSLVGDIEIEADHS